MLIKRNLSIKFLIKCTIDFKDNDNIIGDDVMFCEKLRHLRKHQELSQEYVCKCLGISRASYSRYECGTNEPDLQTLKKLAIFFDCTVDYLLEIEGTPADNDKVVDLNDFILNGKYTISSN